MKTFKITFKHTEESTYEAEIEAESEEEAKKIFEDDPFTNAGTAFDVQGIDIEFESCEEI